MQGVSEKITFMDFSKDGKNIQVFTEKQEMFYFDLETMKLCMDGFMDLKNEEWETWTSPYGWSVQGIWPPTSNGKDIYCVARNRDKTLLATGDRYGFIKLFNYPVCKVTILFNF